jgi:oxygen-independent coproporphyrinogen-3 oxidase
VETKKELGLYIHIPFCVRKCDYCDFLSAPGTEKMKKEYVEALLTEIKSYQGRTQAYRVPTIFFGGGTPSCIDATDIARIMHEIYRVFTVTTETLEATIEVNPGTVTEEKLTTYLGAGINRVSFGLQSTDNVELKRLGRIHCYEDFLENYKLARILGFRNINIDLMSALPGQTLSSWESTLTKIADLEPEHISAYSLIIEEGTGFYDRYQPGAPSEKELPDEETDRLIYDRTKEILQEYGYHRYEISNYAKAAYECRHNSSYWIGTDYLGLGLGASSLVDGARFSNIHDIKQYISACNEYVSRRSNASVLDHSDTRDDFMKNDCIGIRKDFTLLTREERMEEYMFLGLRRCDGISKSTFFQRFQIEIETIYGEVLEQLEYKKLVTMNEDQIKLTDYGIDISNSVLSEFLLN